MLRINTPPQRDTAPPAVAPSSPWTSLAHPHGAPLLGARSLWVAGISWLEGGRGTAPERIEIRREPQAGPAR